jgi:predicted nucleic acid-binding protein
MNADYFLDSNILLYSFDPGDPRKQGIAKMLVDGAVHEARGVISSQVCQEFCNVMLHKLDPPVPAGQLGEYLKSTVYPLIRVLPSPRLFAEALLIHHQSQYRFYDSLIVAAALEAGVPTLYSEDLQHDRTIGTLRILNPFVE